MLEKANIVTELEDSEICPDHFDPKSDLKNAISNAAAVIESEVEKKAKLKTITTTEKPDENGLATDPRLSLEVPENEDMDVTLESKSLDSSFNFSENLKEEAMPEILERLEESLVDPDSVRDSTDEIFENTSDSHAEPIETISQKQTESEISEISDQSFVEGDSENPKSETEIQEQSELTTIEATGVNLDLVNLKYLKIQL